MYNKNSFVVASLLAALVIAQAPIGERKKYFWQQPGLPSTNTGSTAANKANNSSYYNVAHTHSNGYPQHSHKNG